MMHVPTSPAPFSHDAPQANGGRLVSTTGRILPLLGSALRADAKGGIARVIVEQRFHNPYAEPLAVTYTLPLPADGAVSGFAFRVGARWVKGEIDARRAARERFEQAIADGRSAAILEQDRSSLFTQEIGNIPPGEEVIVEVAIDQRLRWLDEGAWEWRFPTVAAPRYLGDSGRVPDADRVSQDVADAPLEARFTMSCTIRDTVAGGRAPESPTHALACSGSRVELRNPLGAKLDRDVVVRWRVAAPKVGLTLDAGRAPASRIPSRHTHGLLTIVPPSVDARYGAVPRDLIVLLDTSGSMSGEPLAQAVRVTSALVETLRDHDRLEMIEFSSSPHRWKTSPLAATASARREALAWLRSLRASGGTEMRAGILEALAGLRSGAQRQVVLISDGLIGFESQVVAAICDRLPPSSRLHTVGVGSGVNRSLTGPAARAGHGVEVVIGLGEDPERAASRLVARTAEPLLVDLTISGSALVEHAPARLPDLFAGAPAIIGVALRPDGGDLLVRGRTAEGSWEQRIRVAPIDEGAGNQAAVALFGREAVEDLELRLAAGGDAREIDATVERIGIDFQIATRLTSWVAVSEEQTVDPRDALRRERVPHELPYGMSAEGLGLRAPVARSPLRARMVSSPPKTGIEVWSGRPGASEGGGYRGGGGGGGGYGGGGGGGHAPPPHAKPAHKEKEEAKKQRKEMREMARDEEAHDKARIAPPAASAPRDESVPARRSPPLAPPAPKRSFVDPRAPATAPVPKRSIVDTLKDFFTGGEEEKKEAERSPARTLRGRTLLARGPEFVIEVAIEGEPVDWAPRSITVVLHDGRTIEAGVDLRRTTRDPRLAAGQNARLGFIAKEAVDASTIARIVIDEGRLEIELGAG